MSTTVPEYIQKAVQKLAIYGCTVTNLRPAKGKFIGEVVVSTPEGDLEFSFIAGKLQANQVSIVPPPRVFCLKVWHAYHSLREAGYAVRVSKFRKEDKLETLFLEILLTSTRGGLNAILALQLTQDCFDLQAAEKYLSSEVIITLPIAMAENLLAAIKNALLGHTTSFITAEFLFDLHHILDSVVEESKAAQMDFRLFEGNVKAIARETGVGSFDVSEEFSPNGTITIRMPYKLAFALYQAVFNALEGMLEPIMENDKELFCLLEEVIDDEDKQGVQQ